MIKTQKLTKTDFETFKKECEKWIKVFGLLDWDVKYQFAEMEGTAGRCIANYVGCNATIVFSPEFITGELTDKRSHIKETALHEVLELLLYPLTSLTGERTFDDGEVTHQTHRVIQRLMKVL